MRLAILGKAGIRAEALGQMGRGAIGGTGHQGGDRTGPCPSGLGVVRQTKRHQQRTQVRISQAELTEAARRFTDRLGWVVGVAHQDLLSDQRDVDGVSEPIEIELSMLIQKGQQVQAGQVAG